MSCVGESTQMVKERDSFHSPKRFHLGNDGASLCLLEGKTKDFFASRWPWTCIQMWPACCRELIYLTISLRFWADCPHPPPLLSLHQFQFFKCLKAFIFLLPLLLNLQRHWLLLLVLVINPWDCFLVGNCLKCLWYCCLWSCSREMLSSELPWPLNPVWCQYAWGFWPRGVFHSTH